MESELDEIINSVNVIYQNLKQKNDICNKETQTVHQLTGICGLPRKFISNIVSFLDFRTEVPVLLETCKFLNRLISSYSFQMIFYLQVSRIPDRGAEKMQAEQEIKDNDIMLAAPREEIVKNIVKSTKLRDLLLAGIEKTNEKLKENLQKINKLNDDIRIQKQIFSKTSKRRDTIETEFTDLGKEIKKYEFLYSSCKDEHFNHLTKFTDEIKKIEYDKQVLRGHISALKLAIEDAQLENSSLTKKLSLHKENLNKLKNYCNEMLAPKFEKITNTYHKELLFIHEKKPIIKSI